MNSIVFVNWMHGVSGIVAIHSIPTQIFCALVRLDAPRSPPSTMNSAPVKPKKQTDQIKHENHLAVTTWYLLDGGGGSVNFSPQSHVITYCPMHLPNCLFPSLSLSLPLSICVCFSCAHAASQITQFNRTHKYTRNVYAIIRFCFYLDHTKISSNWNVLPIVMS